MIYFKQPQRQVRSHIPQKILPVGKSSASAFPNISSLCRLSVLFGLIFLGILPHSPVTADDLSGEIPTWTKRGMLKGASSTEKTCVRLDRVWVTDEGNGFCIRYFKNKVRPKAGLAIVVFDGDYVGSDWDWSTGLPVRAIYTTNIDGSALLRRTRAHTRKSKDNLLIFVGRPGQLGSSGDHKEKYKRFESRVANAALDEIKQRYDLKHFVLTGQSGGAKLVANLLAKRTDIKCAVMASGGMALHSYAVDHGFAPSIWAKWEDPMRSVNNIAQSDASYYIVAGIGDKIRPPIYQKMYADALASVGADVHFVAFLKPRDPHNLQDEAIEMANRCANGEDKNEVVKGFRTIDIPEFSGSQNELSQTLKEGNKSLVKQWQQYFQMFGYYEGRLDGIYGKNTELAIQRCATYSVCLRAE